MRSLNLDQLRTLTEVVALGNFSAAGRKLNLTQPAVSLHVRELELRFGVRLIERRGRRAYATASGRDLVEQAACIFLACEAAEHAMRRFRTGLLGRVHISSTVTALTYSLPPVLRLLRRDYPGIDLQVSSMATRDSVDGVIDGAIDLALVTLPIKAPRLKVTPLLPETLVAILPPGTADVPDVVTPDFLATQPLVLDYERGAVHALAMEWLSGEALSHGEPMCVGTVEAVKKCVACDLGTGLVPDVAVTGSPPEYIVRPLLPPAPCTVALIEQQRSEYDPALSIVRGALLGLRVEP